MKSQIKNIVLLGSGNLATHLALTLHQNNIDVLQIYSRKLENAELLAVRVNADAIDSLREIRQDADLYILALADAAIPIIAKEFNVGEKLVVHTSGSQAMAALKNTSGNFGVFYPLYSFSKNKAVDFRIIPIGIEANSNEKLEQLRVLAKSISTDTRDLNSQQREIIHLAAVFASNFTNHMYAIAHDILAENDLSFDILKPIINEVAQKVQQCKPHDAQTGPAIREDLSTLEKHLGALEHYPDKKKIYDLITRDIIKRYKNKEKDDQL
jgi:predicted short-subunit dehydrogenase-like oxidoreductase (DUF2520 family)